MTTFQGNTFFINADFPFHIHRYVIRKGEIIPPHTHDFIELVYAAKGSARHEMSGQTYELAEGGVFVLEPHVYHSYIGSESGEALVYNVLFNLSFLEHELAALSRLPAFVDFFYLAPFLRKNAAFLPYTPLTERQSIHIERNLNTIFTEFQDKQDGYPLIIKTRLIECLVLLSRYQQENRQQTVLSLSDDACIHTITKFVEQHYNQTINLEQVSRICGMSVSSFTAKFRAVHGQSFVSYKQEDQIREARRLLESTSMKVLEIALETGFNDISFFNKIFRKHTGLSPRTIRSRAAAGRLGQTQYLS